MSSKSCRYIKIFFYTLSLGGLLLYFSWDYVGKKAKKTQEDRIQFMKDSEKQSEIRKKEKKEDYRHEIIDSSGDFYFSAGIWAGEGIPRFSAKENINVFATPNKKLSPVEGVSIKPGTEISFKKTLLKTITPGEVKIEKEENVEAQNYGKVKFISKAYYYSSGTNQNLEFMPGDTIKVLSYRAEGHYFYEFKGDVFSGKCSACFEGQPLQEWWVQTEINGETYWVLIEEDSVNFLPRSF